MLESFCALVTLGVGVLVIVAVSYVSVGKSDKRQEDKDCHCNYSKHQRRNRQLVVLDEWSISGRGKKCKQFVLLGVSYLQNNLDAGLTGAASKPFRRS